MIDQIDLSPLWISLRIATSATVITVFLGIAAAYYIHRYSGRWRSLLDSLFLAPLVLPPTVLGFLLLLLLGKNGPLGSLLSAAGLGIVFTGYAAVITATVVAFPLMYKTTLGAFEQIDHNLQQAARTLGASELTVFLKITLPLSAPSLLAGTMLSFARALGEFGATLMLAGNIPGRTQTLPMAIYFAVEGGDFREAALWTGVILGLSLGAVVLVNSRARFRYQHSSRNRNSFFQGSSQLEREQLNKKPTPDLSQSLAPYLAVNIRKELPGFCLAVSFEADNQQPLGLLGASGAGKSLILRCIAGIETPDAGRIVLNGRVLFDSARGIDLPSCDRKVGILFQNYALFPHLTVAENVAFGLGKVRSRCYSKGHITAAVTQQLAAVQLEAFSQRYPHELSGGQQQRAALARSLASEPDILLLDEPFSALDTHLRSQIEQQLLTRLQTYQGITLLVTHNLEEAYRFCDYLLVLNRGKALAHASKHHIFEQPKTVDIARLTGCKNFSPVIVHSPHQVEAQHWRCILNIIEPLPPHLTHIGIRAHQVTFLTTSSVEFAAAANTFHCWLAAISETPHRMTLYLKLHQPPSSPHDYHLQAEVLKEKWFSLQGQPLPWRVFLDPRRLILLADDAG